MTRMRAIATVLALLVSVRAFAQSPTQELPAGHAPVSEESLRRALGEGAPPIAEVRPAQDVPAGTIEVQVVDASGAPLANVDVRLGLLARGQSAGERHLRTGSNGVGRFSDVPADVAARVTLDHHGARTLTAPIQMQAGIGQRVFLRRLETTTVPRALLQRVGRTIVEWKTDRVRITQLVELLNFGAETFVFAEPGLFYPLPEGALAFEADRSMNDQRLTATEGGFRIAGSIPPGSVQLSWHFDLPLHGETFEFDQDIPFRQTVAYQIVVDAAEGMALEARAFPDAQKIDYEGRKLLVTEAERTPQDPPIANLHFTVTGIPGPGPFRYLAIFASMAGIFLGFAAWKSAATPKADERERARALLLAQVDELVRQKADGTIGDEYFARERERLVEELALLEHAATAG